MKISRIDITNFRAIRSLSYEPQRHINLIIGENGAGKSSLLAACNVLLSWLVARINNAKGNGIKLTDSDISIGATMAKLEVTLDNGTSWRLVKYRSTRRDTPEKSHIAEATALANNIIEQATASTTGGCRLPIISIYGVNRSVTDIPLRLRQRHALSPLDAYRQQIPLRTFFEWYREREDIENDAYRHNSKNFTPDSQLQAIKTAINAVMPGYDNFHVQRSPRAFMLNKDGVILNFAQLSDGEKCYFTLVADIARQLAMCNTSKVTSPLEGDGMVLIDEVDLHLHPQWQSMVLSRLASTFPNVQFFITTHSPIVVADAKVDESNGVLIMKNGAAYSHDDNTYGSTVSEVLTNCFEMTTLRNATVQKQLERIWSMLAVGDHTSEQFQTSMLWLTKNVKKSDLEFAKINLEIKKLQKNEANPQA